MEVSIIIDGAQIKLGTGRGKSKKLAAQMAAKDALSKKAGIQMGLFSFLKEKIFGKSTAQKEKYVTGLDKSRKNFASKLKALTARYSKVNEEYFDELEQILIEADVGVNLTLDIINYLVLIDILCTLAA